VPCGWLPGKNLGDWERRRRPRILKIESTVLYDNFIAHTFVHYSYCIYPYHVYDITISCPVHFTYESGGIVWLGNVRQCSTGSRDPEMWTEISIVHIMTALRIAQSRIQASLKPTSRARMVHMTSQAYAPPVQSSQAGPSRIPIIRTLEEMRAWRRTARERKLDVGIVPTVSPVRVTLADR